MRQSAAGALALSHTEVAAPHPSSVQFASAAAAGAAAMALATVAAAAEAAATVVTAAVAALGTLRQAAGEIKCHPAAALQTAWASPIPAAMTGRQVSASPAGVVHPVAAQPGLQLPPAAAQQLAAAPLLVPNAALEQQLEADESGAECIAKLVAVLEGGCSHVGTGRAGARL
jgi:hypothetical protein